MLPVDELSDFARTGSAQAFALLVQRNVDLVYSTALRISRDGHLADDITQAVFIVLARRAHSIHPSHLAGWLVNTARLAARDVLRTRSRQHRRDVEAARMRSEIQSGDEPTVEQLSPLLDHALAKLSEVDRSAVVMRFLQGRTFADVGETLGVAEDTARKRVERAIEKMRKHLCKAGVAPSAAGIAVVLAATQAKAAPALVEAHAAALGSFPPTATAISRAVLWSLNLMKVKTAAVVILATIILVGTGTAIIEVWHPKPAVISVTPQPTTLAAQVPATVPSDGSIQANDRLDISVMDLIGLNVQTTFKPRVQQSGEINLPFIGNVQAAGKTLTQLQNDITQIFRDKGIIRNAKVKVARIERSPDISIVAATFQPGDNVLIHVFDLVEMGQVTTTLQVVNEKGEIQAPWIPAANMGRAPRGLANLQLAGFNEGQAADKIASAYAGTYVLASAHVSVERISAKEAKTLAVSPDPEVDLEPKRTRIEP